MNLKSRLSKEQVDAAGRAVDGVLKFVIEALPRAEQLALEAIEVIFVPQVILQQIALWVVLQTGAVTVRTLLKSARYLLSSMTKRTREIRRLRNSILHVEKLTEWKELADSIDRLEGHDSWRMDPSCHFYEKERLAARIEEFRHLIKRSDIFDIMFTLRGGINRSKYGLLHQGLFSKAMAGTKLLVEEYNAMICAGLDFVCDGDVLDGDEPIPTNARLAFFNETRHSYGRTALLLSGGAALGFYHTGVVKALIESNLMPRVIGGASAGSILCAMVGTRTDEEMFKGIFQVKGCHAPGHYGVLALDFFRPQGYSVNRDYSLEKSCDGSFFGSETGSTGFWSDLKRAFVLMTPSGMRWICGIISDVLTGQMKARDMLMNDTNHFRRCCKLNIGNFTFQEAFDRTGRILNITGEWSRPVC